MNDTIVGIAIAAVAPTLMAWAALIQARRSVVLTEKSHEVTAEMATEVKAVHIAVNSNLTQVTVELAEANQRIVELHELVANMMKQEVRSAEVRVAEVKAPGPQTVEPDTAAIEPLLAASKTVDAALHTVGVVADSTLKKAGPQDETPQRERGKEEMGTRE